MGKFMNMLVPVDSIDPEKYLVLPLGSAGEAFVWLSDLIAQGSGAVGYVRREVSIIAALKRALLKYDGVTFAVPQYQTEKDAEGKTVRVKDTEGKPIKLYDPPASERMGAVFTRHHANGASVHIDRLDGDESIPTESRELVRVTVQ